MGERGPVPKDRRLGHTAKPDPDDMPVTTPNTDVVVVPDGDPDWHPVALRWFDSLKVSPQRVFYTNSDWLTAYAVAESMSRELKPQVVVVGSGKDATVEMHELPPKAASLAAWLKGATALLATVGDRRRAGVELERPRPDGDEEADVSHLDDARARLRGAG